MVPELHLALQEWVAAHGKNIRYVQKGENCFTEMYSAISADVPMANDPTTSENIPLLEELTATNVDKVSLCIISLSFNWKIRLIHSKLTS